MAGVPRDPQARLDAANELIAFISTCGRRFFSHQGRCAYLERDARGRIWWHDAYSGKRVYTHYRWRWRGFTQGGTMKRLVEQLCDFVVHGRQLHPRTFGPWPDWLRSDMSEGPWAYGAGNMRMVRDLASRLGIIDSREREIEHLRETIRRIASVPCAGDAHAVRIDVTAILREREPWFFERTR